MKRYSREVRIFFPSNPPPYRRKRFYVFVLFFILSNDEVTTVSLPYVPKDSPIRSTSEGEKGIRLYLVFLFIKDQNIGKHGYIGNWILRKYRKYR